MKIRVNTVQLTKRRLRQMATATQTAMEQGKVLGHFLRVQPNQYKTYIIFHADDYYLISSHWKRSLTRVSCKDDKFWTYKEFQDEARCLDWWRAYERVKKEGDKKHLYI